MLHMRKEGAENGVGSGPRWAFRSLAWVHHSAGRSRKREPEESLGWGGGLGSIAPERSATENRVAVMRRGGGWQGSRNCECEQSRAEADARGSGV